MFVLTLTGLLLLVSLLEHEVIPGIWKVIGVTVIMGMMVVSIWKVHTHIEKIDYEYNLTQALEGVDESNEEQVFKSLRDYFTAIGYEAFTCEKSTRKDKYKISFYDKDENKLVRLEVTDEYFSQEGFSK